MLSKIYTALTIGLDVFKIDVEVDISKGNLPRFNIVGLPDMAVKEARERIRAAIKNSNIKFPWQRVIVVNLAPADVKKEGTLFDLPIAVGILKALEYEMNTDDSLFMGELALDGSVRAVHGVLSCALYARDNGFRKIYVPEENAVEAALVDDIEVYPVKNVNMMVRHLAGEKAIPVFDRGTLKNEFKHTVDEDIDMAFIKGQSHAKRALEIAAAGGHNILLSGPPGSGKTLLARTFTTILPELTKDEMLEVTKLYSIAGMLSRRGSVVHTRPFRTPHHSSSGVSLVGGGRIPRPGEISLAHRGVLFLDELPEFSRSVLENLRQPLEDGVVTVARAEAHLTFPAEFMLVAAQNPCPCGFATDEDRDCSCPPGAIERYQRKVSGPLMDRIDLHLEVPRLSFSKLVAHGEEERSSVIAARVEVARKKQRARLAGSPISINARMSGRMVKEYCVIPPESETLLHQAVDQFSLSPRAYFKILKVARTIADLEGDADIQTAHITEALQYRFRQTNG